MSLAVGIDLGTTNSCIAIYKDDKFDIIEAINGKRTVPSVVYYDVKGEKSIGDEAIQKSRSHADRAIYDIKRLLGSKSDEMEEQLHYLSFNVTTNEDDRYEIVLPENSSQQLSLRTEEVAAEILKHLKENAEIKLKVEITDAVVTVPAYYTNSQRQATMDAARIAGLNVLKLIPEPTAAALAFAHEQVRSQDRLIVVYDLGGGTFDVSLIQTSAQNDHKVLAVDGASWLGGRDFDNRLLEFILEEMQEGYGISTRQLTNKRFKRRVERECEEIKKLLSSADSTQFVFHDVEDQYIDMAVSRETFERLNKELFESTITILDKMLKETKVNKSQIDEVLLVGGSSRIPKIQQMIQNYFDGKVPNKTVNPDEAVAMGAAIQATLLRNRCSETHTINDVTPRSLGVEVIEKDTMNVIIRKNTPIPVKIEKVYFTFYDSQTEADIRIFEGESSNAEDNAFLGELKIEGITPRPKGKIKFIVTFELNSNGILKIIAREPSKNINKDLSINLKDGRLTDHAVSEAQARVWMSNKSKLEENEEMQSSTENFAVHHTEPLLDDETGKRSVDVSDGETAKQSVGFSVNAEEYTNNDSIDDTETEMHEQDFKFTNDPRDFSGNDGEHTPHSEMSGSTFEVMPKQTKPSYVEENRGSNNELSISYLGREIQEEKSRIVIANAAGKEENNVAAEDAPNVIELGECELIEEKVQARYASETQVASVKDDETINLDSLKTSLQDTWTVVEKSDQLTSAQESGTIIINKRSSQAEWF